MSKKIVTWFPVAFITIFLQNQKKMKQPNVKSAASDMTENKQDLLEKWNNSDTGHIKVCHQP